MPDETQNVPQWFTDFAVKNADEHGQLATKIEASNGELSARIEASNGELATKIEASKGQLATEIARAETRTTRWFIAALAVAVSVLSAITIFVN